MLLRALLIGTAALTLGAGFSHAAPPKPSQFTAKVDNPWFPLKPGSAYVYRGVKDGEPSREVLTVTHKTAKINGVPCVVVDDRLYVRGRLHERTTDWYTQDKRGNVWYYGEQTAELDKSGHVKSTAGTWQAGKDGAVPGIYMPGHPRVGYTARQEFYKGHAEDHFQILDLRTSINVPWGKSHQALLTKEWTPLEPGTIDHKYYVRGVGTVLEQTVKGGNERNALVSFKTAG
ncbi:MAG TPA: hypothetical protein VIL91_08715 [Gaiellaceae bacterium]|jgi:hypothetical protein